MEFDQNAKANTVSALLQVVKWVIWIVFGVIVLFIALIKPDEDPDWNWRGAMIIVGAIGYGLGYLVQKYHDSILKSRTQEDDQTEHFDQRVVDNFLRHATDEEERQLDEAWFAPKHRWRLEGVELNDAGYAFMEEAYKRQIPKPLRRRIFLSLCHGAPIDSLYNMLPENNPNKKRI